MQDGVLSAPRIPVACAPQHTAHGLRCVRGAPAAGTMKVVPKCLQYLRGAVRRFPPVSLFKRLPTGTQLACGSRSQHLPLPRLCSGNEPGTQGPCPPYIWQTPPLLWARGGAHRLPLCAHHVPETCSQLHRETVKSWHSHFRVVLPSHSLPRSHAPGATRQNLERESRSE